MHSITSALKSNKQHKQVSLLLYSAPQVVSVEQQMQERLLKQKKVPKHAETSCDFTDPETLYLMSHACREADASKIDVDEILRTIAPPREWIEEGKLYRQHISSAPSTRADVHKLTQLLNEQLAMRQARPDGICPVRREIATECFNELIRQVTAGQPERGLLLLRVRDELQMTLRAYQDLYLFSSSYDSRKTVLREAELHKLELEVKQMQLQKEYDAVKEERDKLLSQLEHDEQIFREARESRLKKHYEEYQFLKRVNNALKQHIDAVSAPTLDESMSMMGQSWKGGKKKAKCKY